jgi:tetratricopeptide (TPR) repeat protein
MHGSCHSLFEVVSRFAAATAILALSMILWSCQGARDSEDTPEAYTPKYNTIGHLVLEIESGLGVEPNYRLLDKIIDETSATLTTKGPYTREDAFGVLVAIDRVLDRKRFLFMIGVNLFSDMLTLQGLTSAQVRDLRRVKSVVDIWNLPEAEPGQLFLKPIQKAYVRNHIDEKYYFGDCDMFSLMYLSIADALDLPVRMVLLPDHAFLRWHYDGEDKYFNFEAHDLGWHSTPEYRLRYQIGEETIASRAYLVSMTDREVLAQAYWRRAGEWMKRFKRDEAIQDFNQAIKMAPHSATALAARGHVYYAMGEWGLAIDNYTSAISLHPNSVDWLNQRATCFEMKEDYEAALADLNRVVELHPDEVCHYLDRLEIRRELEDRQGLIADLTRLIELEPESAEYYGMRASAYAGLEEYDKALADCERVLELEPDHSMARITRARILHEKGETEKAIADLTQLIQEHPMQSDAYMQRSLIYQDRDEDEAALEDAKRAHFRAPFDPLVMNNLAWLLVTSEDPEVFDVERGLELAQRAARTMEAPHIVDTLAVAYAQKGDFEKAIELEEKAVALLGEEDKARDRYVRLLEHFRQRKPYSEFDEED